MDLSSEWLPEDLALDWPLVAMQEEQAVCVWSVMVLLPPPLQLVH